MPVCVCVCVCACVCVYTYMYVCMYIRMYVCMYVYAAYVCVLIPPVKIVTEGSLFFNLFFTAIDNYYRRSGVHNRSSNLIHFFSLSQKSEPQCFANKCSFIHCRQPGTNSQKSVPYYIHY